MMKCFTIIGGVAHAGIALASTSPPTVAVGQAGRGRRQVTVPVPPGAVIEDGRLLAVSSVDETAVAVVLVADHSGYRGSWRWREVPTANCPSQIREGTCQVCGADYGHHRPYPAGDAPVPGRIIAQGWSAQGDAGRMGGGGEYLLALPPGRYAIGRSGRLYGAPAVVVITVTADGDVTATDGDVTAASW
jgi:hypothetical protein